MNTSPRSEYLYKGVRIATASPQFEANVLGIQEDKPQHVSGYHLEDSLDETRKGQLRSILDSFSDLFWKEGDTLPTIQANVQHEIYLKSDATPKWSKPRRLSPEQREEVAQEIQNLFRQGLIQESVSPWAAPIVVARRKKWKIALGHGLQAFEFC